MNPSAHLPLIGSRIRLRPLGPEDAPQAATLLGEVEVRRFLNQREAPDVATLRELYRESERLLERGEAFYLAIEPLAGGPLVGTMGIRFPRHPRLANLGYWLGHPWWGRGWMSEAVVLASEFCFRRCFAARVDASVRVGNLGSRKVLERAGFQLDGTLRWNVPDGTDWADEWIFTRTREDWEGERTKPPGAAPEGS